MRFGSTARGLLSISSRSRRGRATFRLAQKSQEAKAAIPWVQKIKERGGLHNSYSFYSSWWILMWFLVNQYWRNWLLSSEDQWAQSPLNFKSSQSQWKTRSILSSHSCVKLYKSSKYIHKDWTGRLLFRKWTNITKWAMEVNGKRVLGNCFQVVRSSSVLRVSISFLTLNHLPLCQSKAINQRSHSRKKWCKYS